MWPHKPHVEKHITSKHDAVLQDVFFYFGKTSILTAWHRGLDLCVNCGRGLAIAVVVVGLVRQMEPAHVTPYLDPVSHRSTASVQQ